jgi:hypothetical protein
MRRLRPIVRSHLKVLPFYTEQQQEQEEEKKFQSPLEKPKKQALRKVEQKIFL